MTADRYGHLFPRADDSTELAGDAEFPCLVWRLNVGFGQRHQLRRAEPLQQHPSAITRRLAILVTDQ